MLQVVQGSTPLHRRLIHPDLRKRIRQGRCHSQALIGDTLAVARLLAYQSTSPAAAGADVATAPARPTAPSISINANAASIFFIVISFCLWLYYIVHYDEP